MALPINSATRDFPMTPGAGGASTATITGVVSAGAAQRISLTIEPSLRLLLSSDSPPAFVTSGDVLTWTWSISATGGATNQARLTHTISGAELDVTAASMPPGCALTGAVGRWAIDCAISARLTESPVTIVASVSVQSVAGGETVETLTVLGEPSGWSMGAQSSSAIQTV
ncbi:MAG TPA: hypothetical protein PLV68_16285 [Ilumatobacteraceae bacterium]|nr:hypothetical protein [Ilumatobacteraceae bacterium]